MTNRIIMYRQGDVLLTKIKKLPKGSKIKRTDIILEGEATGHAHRLVNGTIYEKFLWPDNGMYVDATSGYAKIVHDEHNTIEIESGYYVVTRQREYEPSRFTRDGQSRWVLD